MPFSDDEELLTERELGEYIKRSLRQLQRDRTERRGIPFVQVQTQIRYRRGDVRAYVAEHLVVGQRAEHTAAADTAALQPRHRAGSAVVQRASAAPSSTLAPGVAEGMGDVGGSHGHGDGHRRMSGEREA
jgi:hypothetical protein